MGQHIHHHPVRIYYEDTDAGGIVYHANYLRFCERARSEMLRSAGCNNAQLAAETGFMFVVRHAELDYHLPALLDDALEVQSTITKIGGASAVIKQDIYREETLLVNVQIVLVCIDIATKRPVKIPDSMREILGRFTNDTEA